jgi:hypothetical protein
MLHIAHPKVLIRTGHRPRSTTTVTAPRALARSPRAQSLAAPITLAIVVVSAELCAASVALVGALGG